MKRRVEFEVAWWVPWLMCFLILVPIGRALGPSANVRPQDPLTVFGPALKKAEITPTGRVAESILQLEKAFAERTDLQQSFGTGEDMNLAAVLSWATSDADSGTFQLIPYRSELRQLLDKIQS